MEIKSNGYFSKKRDFDISVMEDIDFIESSDNTIANLVVWGYNKLIDDLKILPKKLDDNDSLVYNCYVEFTRNNKFWFTISFYDFDNSVDSEVLSKIKEIRQEIRIEINTDKEIKIFKDKVNNALSLLGLGNIKKAFKNFDEEE